MSGRLRRRGIAWVLCFAACTCGPVRADQSPVEQHLAAATATLTDVERQTLAKITTTERKLLALRAYLRVGQNLKSRWSWTDAQILAYEQSAEFDRLLADIAAIKREFERRNPGYTLYANTQVRSLDTQIERWNSNPRVGATARNLHDALKAAFSRQRAPDRASLAKFERALREWRPSPTSPLAAPGLSMHGQSRAIDFQIMKDGRIVAATEVGAVAREWEATGWSRKLEQAVHAASTRFRGPLAAPNEPWHYEYRGEGDTVKR